MARDKAPAGTFQPEATASEILEQIQKLRNSKTGAEIPADLTEFLKAWPGIETASGQEVSGAELRHSFAGRVGRAIEPVIRPLGFDWKIGIGLVASFAAREVFVSTMSVVYNVGGYDESEESTASLAETLRQQTRPDGSQIYTPLTGITLMVFYVFAMQCVSTVAVVRRETNSWRWPLFQIAYMTGLAWFLALVVYQGGRLFGFH
jgi:ferrous iron transport protein B